ncbi:MAG: hypothetical protein HRT89_03885, partial [Lentisphaeria bacterium]|nr:non-lysosomal glucosylceramidase [Lentisphaeria bacterium]NQZ67190.1 hypothetical protein [Lentisphaeria bacterium]
LDFWDDFTDDGELDARTDKKTNSPAASVAIKTRIPAKGSRTFTYIIAWHFPNRQTWSPDNDCDSACDCTTVNTIGNHYCEQFTDAWDAASKVAQNLKSLEQDSLKFVTSFCKSDYPDAVKDAALSNLAILKTQTCFRTPDGHFYGWEGVGPSTGCCSGSCTHVWNYEQAVAFLFSELSQSMRIVEFAHATNDEGCMSFRVNLPLDKKAMSFKRAAADGQMGCIMKIYRDWQLCGDDTFLKELWPNVKRSLEFCWVPGGWDADQDGVMEGCQHNTMDVEYYGPNPQMGCWYLGALRAAEEMASYLGDDAFADRCNDLFKRGSKWIDDELFNGEFYEHHVVAPKKGTDIHPSLAAGMGSDDLKEPEYQLANGCLVDQLVGQYMAHICGLGYLLKKSNIKKTLRSIYKYNRKSGFHDHFNSMRSYVLGDETALLMANYPKDRPKLPFPYFTEVMTGFEYTAAVGMLYEDLEKQGLQCIGDIRARYNGRHRNPFDEAECGRYYARAMASWAAIPALSDFLYSAVEQSIQFTEKSGTYFWSTGSAWGNAIVTKTGLKLTVEFGSIKIKSIQLGQRQSKLKTASSLSKGRSKLFKI